MTETPEEYRFVEEALAAADSGNAGHWPTVAGYLADEVRRLRAEPTFTASELKERLETATTVALALGRKEAGEEIAAAIDKARNGSGEVGSWDHGMRDAAEIAQDIASQPRQAVSEPLTAPTGHSDLPPTPEARRIRIPEPTTRLEGCGVHHGYPELHHCSECLRAYCGRAGAADLAPASDLPEGSDQ